MKSPIKVLVVLFVFLLAYHGFLQLTFTGEETFLNQWIVPVMGIIFIYGSYFGLKSLQGQPKQSNQARGLLFASLAGLFYGIGLFVWAYYSIVLGNDFPFPSIADYVWLVHVAFLVISFLYFFKIFKSSVSFSKVLISAILIFIGSYFMFKFIGVPTFDLEEGIGFDGNFFNLFYSVSDFIVMAVSIIILSVAGGKIYRGLFVYVIGMLFMVAGDVLFTIREVDDLLWQGDVSDLMFSIAGFCMSFGIIALVKNLNTRNY